MRQDNDLRGVGAYTGVMPISTHKDAPIDITLNSHVADIAVAMPATIKVFQRYHIDFCCGGRIPLAEACEQHGVDPHALLADLQAVHAGAAPESDWWHAPITDLVAHIQARYHEPLRAELPRLAAMLDKVVSRHGDSLPELLRPLQATYSGFFSDLIDHMLREDEVIFPAIVDAVRSSRGPEWRWVEEPVEVLVAEHAAAGAALASMRAITRGYAPPEGACPTFRGLYFGLAQLEQDMHVHVHLENHILFPRLAQLVGSA